ncbi:hypothetical protein P3T26_007710 [Streptomyces sp. MAA16]|nr:hypothetical protein [Streptomyces sp. MAA16]
MTTPGQLTTVVPYWKTMVVWPWLESKRLLTSPERHIDTLRCLLTQDNNAVRSGTAPP